MKNEYVAEVLEKLSNNPTAQDLDYFVEAYARIGYLTAIARGMADNSEAERKYQFATEFARAKGDGAKTSSDADSSATIAVKPFVEKELKAREVAAKMSNLLAAIEQAINAIKYLGKATDTVMLPTRR